MKFELNAVSYTIPGIMYVYDEKLVYIFSQQFLQKAVIDMNLYLHDLDFVYAREDPKERATRKLTE